LHLSLVITPDIESIKNFFKELTSFHLREMGPKKYPTGGRWGRWSLLNNQG
jgi:hypothetical protein